MDLGLKGKVAVITGGSRGIGFAIAQAFLQEGASVAITGRDAGALQNAAASLRRYGTVFEKPVDATDFSEMKGFADDVANNLGGIDCWINNVGAVVARAGKQFSTAEIDETSAICFRSAVIGCQTAYPYMKARGGGAIVNISSLAARCGTAGRSTLYGPLKAAVRELSVMFAAEYAADGIRVNTVLPGFTLTPAVQNGILPSELSANAAATLLKRVASPEEIAWPVVFLCSKLASFITAASLEVSGGRGMVLNPNYSFEKKERDAEQ